MADIERALGGDSLIARDWAERALKAPRDAQWSCGACSRPHGDWSPVCAACGAFDTLSWQSGDRGTVEPVVPGDSISTYARAAENAGALYRNTVKKAPGKPAPSPTSSDVNTTPSLNPDDKIVFATPRAPDDPGPEAEDYTQVGDDKRRKGSGLW